MATTNYNLPTITGNMTADVVRDMNALAEATDGAIKTAVDGVDLSTIQQAINTVDQRVTTHLDESTGIAHKAKNIALEDVDGLFVGTELESAMKELFINVSDGKQLVGTAITDTDNRLVVPAKPTFQNLADLIRSIKTGKSHARGTFTTATGTATITGSNGGQAGSFYYDFDFSLLDFVPEYVFFIVASKNDFNGVVVWSNKTIYYISATNYGNVITPQSGAYRIPYSNGVVRLALQKGSTSYDWFAYGE